MNARLAGKNVKRGRSHHLRIIEQQNKLIVMNPHSKH